MKRFLKSGIFVSACIALSFVFTSIAFADTEINVTYPSDDYASSEITAADNDLSLIEGKIVTETLELSAEAAIPADENSNSDKSGNPVTGVVSNFIPLIITAIAAVSVAGITFFLKIRGKNGKKKDKEIK